jgi:hypothetical protein
MKTWKEYINNGGFWSFRDKRYLEELDKDLED